MARWNNSKSGTAPESAALPPKKFKALKRFENQGLIPSEKSLPLFPKYTAKSYEAKNRGNEPEDRSSKYKVGPGMSASDVRDMAAELQKQIDTNPELKKLVEGTEFAGLLKQVQTFQSNYESQLPSKLAKQNFNNNRMQGIRTEKFEGKKWGDVASHKSSITPAVRERLVDALKDTNDPTKNPAAKPLEVDLSKITDTSAGTGGKGGKGGGDAEFERAKLAIEVIRTLQGENHHIDASDNKHFDQIVQIDQFLANLEQRELDRMLQLTKLRFESTEGNLNRKLEVCGLLARIESTELSNRNEFLRIINSDDQASLDRKIDLMRMASDIEKSHLNLEQKEYAEYRRTYFDYVEKELSREQSEAHHVDEMNLKYEEFVSKYNQAINTMQFQVAMKEWDYRFQEQMQIRKEQHDLNKLTLELRARTSQQTMGAFSKALGTGMGIIHQLTN